MADSLGDLDKFIEAYRKHFETTLGEFVGIPSVSADPGHKKDIAKMADAAKALLQDLGFKVELVPTPGNPVVLGKFIKDPSHKTLALYNHLDVQPADLSEWKTEPFNMVIKDSRYIGRGATDDKGPALSAIAAIKYAIQANIPLNFIVIWELEEEVGSPHFEDFLATNEAGSLKPDSVMVSDTQWISSTQPAISCGLRGLVTFEVSLRTASQDVHSGSAGGAARNPIGELCQIISECYDAKTGEVKIPGFYDDVAKVTKDELDGFVASGFNAKDFAEKLGLESLRVNDDQEVARRIMAAPTFEVHGLVGGYTGPGVKTVIPPAASVKLSTRLVPNQSPAKILALIKNFIQSRWPDAKVTLGHAAEPYLGETTGPYAEAVSQAVTTAFGKAPVFVREGGSIGAVLSMKHKFGVPITMLGLSLPEHGYHAPNECFDWQQASSGIKMFVNYFDKIAKLK